MPAQNSTNETLTSAQVAELNDLLQLDHDAIQAYTLAIRALTNVGRRETLIRFRGDHERHVTELTAVIRRYGGLPIELPHLPTGPLKLAMQGAGTLGTDREVLLAFKTNERQARDKYVQAAERADALPDDARDTVRRGAADEERHYDWASEQLETLGAGAETRVGRAAAVVERVHAGAAEGVERVAREGMRGFEAARRGAVRGVTAARASAARGVGAARRGATQLRERVPGEVTGRHVGVALAAAGIGFVVAAVLSGSRRRR
jgi:rubrerythrin